jgi:acetyl-CoA C-acetyltransferase
VARQAWIGAGGPTNVPATTINKVCGSGLRAVMLAAQAIKSGDASVVVAGGAENMSRAPYLLEKARGGYRMGDATLVDSMVRDGLWDVYNNLHMGTCGDRTAATLALTRDAQDAFAIASYQRALAAQQQGWFGDEITPVEVKDRKALVTVDQDEGPSRFNEEKMRKLAPAFGKDGTVTAANASSVNDGAAAVVVASSAAAEKLGLPVRARIVGYGVAAREPEWFTLAPIRSIQQLLQRVGWSAGDVDLFEINEAFACVPMAAMRELSVPHEKVNVHGGAIALGHPIGASGARVLVTLLHAMKRRGVKRGVASLCVGGGEAVSMAVEAVS